MFAFPVQQTPSPNCDERPAGIVVELLVVHYISLPANVFRGSCVEDLFLNRLDVNAHPSFTELEGLKVSAHFLIRRSGKVIQFVDTRKRAWHAGVSSFQGRERCNDFSIGVELEGSGDRPFTPSQYARLCALTTELTKVHPLRFVVGHSDIAPGRKVDPGPHFNWPGFLDAVENTGLRRPF